MDYLDIGRMIEVKVLTKQYGNTKALKGVSFTLNKKITSIIGRNGAGKTTLLRILSTQLLPTSGSASINNYDVIKDARKVREIIASIPQESKAVYYRTVFDSVRLYLSARGMSISNANKEAKDAIKKVGLWEARNTATWALSGGMKRKIFVAMAYASDSEIVFLDEPTTALDPLSRLEVWSAIKELKGQVVLTTHYMEEAQALSQDVIMLDGGKILAHGKVDRLLEPLKGMVRIEGGRRKRSYRVGNTYVSYVKKEQAEGFILAGDIVKPITLDDLFIKKGVNLES